MYINYYVSRISNFRIYTAFTKRIHDEYFNTLLDDTSGYVLFFGLIGKGLLWICKKYFQRNIILGFLEGLHLLLVVCFYFSQPVFGLLIGIYCFKQ